MVGWKHSAMGRKHGFRYADKCAERRHCMMFIHYRTFRGFIRKYLFFITTHKLNRHILVSRVTHDLLEASRVKRRGLSKLFIVKNARALT